MVLDLVVESNAETYSSNELPDNDLARFHPGNCVLEISPKRALSSTYGCRHVVKDRLEQTGMRWNVNGAQAMLHLRDLPQWPVERLRQLPHSN